jgi:hypothetical protein
MRIKFILTAAALVAGLLSADVRAQNEKMDLDRYIATGKTIVIAKILSTTPVKRGGDYQATVKILHVVKGIEKEREIEVTLKFTPVETGKIYLLRTESAAESEDRMYFYVRGRESAVQLSPFENIEELKKLPVRIVILRTMNLRKDYLENEIRRHTYEFDALQEITKGQ